MRIIAPALPLLNNERNTPFRLAELWYAHYSDVPLARDVLFYLEHGVVISSPACFALASISDLRPQDKEGKPIGDTPEWGWFVRFASGDLAALLNAVPCYLPKISFHRDNKEVRRVWRLDRLIAVARARAGKGRV